MPPDVIDLSSMSLAALIRKHRDITAPEEDDHEEEVKKNPVPPAARKLVIKKTEETRAEQAKRSYQD